MAISQRQKQAGSLVTKEVSEFIRREDWPELTGLVTILRSEVSADLKHARIFFSVLNQDETEALKILKKHLYQIQGHLNKTLVMKNIPRIELVLDDTAEEVLRLNKLIDSLDQE